MVIIVRWKSQKPSTKPVKIALTGQSTDTITVSVGEEKIAGVPSGGLCSVAAAKAVAAEQSHSDQEKKHGSEGHQHR